ncbi:uncharacterized protein F5147DRAFT_775702 [Suillus discolor]|uniref:Uncharacterized protein n=1 Tax=Suillus discolor TaxID=1912936 RepID=A0A9P7JS28_9AGAM|nr:uncharacterized protein F5147DRAFT_775702 [Suillus discolor]KAG2103991.1 hypothetical protein F5147DRAFT_775702 [Suillus discolor]
MSSAEILNRALKHAAATIELILGKAALLKCSNTEELKFAAEIGEILSNSFEHHGISASMIPPVLLSAAMELLEHLDATRKYFVRVPAWTNIQSDDPHIQNHPLKNKASLLTYKLSPSPVTSSFGVSDDKAPSLTTANSASQVKPKPKQVLIKKKGQEPSLDDAIHIVPVAEVMVEALSGKEVASAVWEEDPESACGTTSSPQKRRRNTSQSCLPPNDPTPAARQPWFSSGLTLPVQTAKRAKVTESPNGVIADISMEHVNTVCMPCIPTYKLLTTRSQMMVRLWTPLVIIAKNQLWFDCDLSAIDDLRAAVAALQDDVKVLLAESVTHDRELQSTEQTITSQERYRNILKDGYEGLRQRALASNKAMHNPFPNTVFIPNPAYEGHQSLIPVSISQVQALERLYLDLPSSVNAGGGPSTVASTVGNIPGPSRAAHSFGDSASTLGSK